MFFLFSAALFPHQTQAQPNGIAQERTIEIPGGIQSIAAILKLPEQSINSRQGLARIFERVLELDPARNSASHEKDAGRELIAQLKIASRQTPSSESESGSDAKLPLLLDAGTWNELLPGNKSESILFRFLDNPDAMRLYIALSLCAAESASAWAEAVEPQKLLKASEILLLFSSDIHFDNSGLSFPGKKETWERFLSKLDSKNSSSLQALLAQKGMPLVLYSVLWCAPDPVKDYISASTRQMENLYDILKPYGSGNLNGTVINLAAQDLARILRQCVASSNGLTLNFDHRLGNALLRRILQDKNLNAGAGPIPLTPQILSKLLPRPGISAFADTSSAGMIEFFRCFSDLRKGGLTGELITATTQHPKNTPAFLDIIKDMFPDSALLARYLDYSEKIFEAGNDKWNANRARTSESIFYLLSMLCREGALSISEGNDLLAWTLQAMDVENEAEFAANTIEFLSKKLFPKIAQQGSSEQASFIAALSGNQPPIKLSYKGKELLIDRSAMRQHRMQKVMQSQSHTPLSTLIAIYTQLGEWGSSRDSERITGLSQSLRAAISQVKFAEWTPGETKENLDSLARINIEKVKKELDAERLNERSIRARKIAAQLHEELGVSLLTLCYAYSGIPSIDAIAFDPNFVRKHIFSPMSIITGIIENAHFNQDDKTDGRMTGSLAGLDYELIRLNIQQSIQVKGSSYYADIAPSLFFSARLMKPNLRTERAQEFVALAAKTGARLIALSAVDDSIAQFNRKFLSSLMPEERIDAIEQIASEDNAGTAIDRLSPSERFLLGRAYAESALSSTCQARHSADELCSTIDRIRDVIPTPNTSGFNSFIEEIDQYGTLLRSRIGMSSLSFSFIDSYETLQKSSRTGYLCDRICDLKIRLAEINYVLGLSASLEEMQAELALGKMLKQPFSEDLDNWKETIVQINKITPQMVSGWMDDLLSNASMSSEYMVFTNPKS